MAAPRSKPSASDTVPQQPQTTPTAAPGMQDHSFTLQMIMDLRGAVGEMNATLGSVKTSVDSVKTKVDDLVKWKNMILGGTAVLGVCIGVTVWLATKASEYITFKASTPPAFTQQAPEIAPPVLGPKSPIKKP